jgi:hypothetical protein
MNGPISSRWWGFSFGVIPIRANRVQLSVDRGELRSKVAKKPRGVTP